MSIERSYKRTRDKIIKLNNQVNKSLDIEFYINDDLNNIEWFKNDKCELALITNWSLAKLVRQHICNLYKENIDNSKNWNAYKTIAFMTDMIKFKQTARQYKGNTKKIFEYDKLTFFSRVYNLPKNKIKNTMTILITNLKRGHDKYKIKQWFSPYELYQYQYQDQPDKVFNAFKDNKLTPEELIIYKQLNGVE